MKFSLNDGLAALPGPQGQRFHILLQRGSLKLEVYAPRGQDPQQPHTQDEVYVVQRGQGEFVLEQQRWHCAPGDALFVPAGARHRFENFSDDFAVWVIFYGPQGGEH